MFNNIGAKVKGLATVICILGIISSISSGVLLLFNDAALAGLLSMILGCLFSWIASWVTYCIGETNEILYKKITETSPVIDEIATRVAQQGILTKRAASAISDQIITLEKMQKELLEELKKEKAE